MKRMVLIIAWMSVAVTAVFLRFDDLGSRPMHADEATGARITAQRMESDGGRFDPRHYHGPLLADLAIPVCRLRGEEGWREMTTLSLRLVPAVAGSLLVFVPLLWRRRYGDLASCLAGCFLATSPLLVYYSRMFIHESLLVLFGISAVAMVVAFPRWGLPGLMIGLMFAAKESVVISMLAWGGAAACLVWENRREVDWSRWAELLRTWWRPCGLSLAVAGLTALVFYTHGFSYWQGAVDAVRTFFIYETVAGHDKAFGYYLGLLVWPHKSAGLWWYGAPVLLLAMVAYARSFSAAMEPRWQRIIRFLAYAALGHGLIYSGFAYKTPWLACLPWAHVCVLAGFALVGFDRQTRAMQGVLVMLVSACIVTQMRQSRMATGRLDSDARNPFAYVPTSKDVERMAEWLKKLKAMDGGLESDSAAVVGSGYWPLPWYLRTFDRVGYWPEPPSGVDSFAFVFAMPAQAEGVRLMTQESHVLLPRGLRADVPLQLFVRNDIWHAWMNLESP